MSLIPVQPDSQRDSCSRSILLSGLPDLTKPHFLAPVISSAASATQDRLLIILISPVFSPDDNISHTEQWNEVQRLLTFIYVQATRIAQDMGKVLMEVDVLLKGLSEEVPENLIDEAEVLFRVDGDNLSITLPQSISSLRTIYLGPGPLISERYSISPKPPHLSQLPSRFPVVALGGTFDHLHAGHKILLSMAAWITSEKIIVGITDDALLTSKSNRHILEPLPTRTTKVHSFLSLFCPGIVYAITPINDVFGPTGWDPNIQALVVSKETLSGAGSIAKHREQHSLPPLTTFVIDVIAPDNPNLDHKDTEMLKETKMSSTFIREWIMKNQSKNDGQT